MGKQKGIVSAGWGWVVPLIGGLVWCAIVGYQGLNGQDSHDYLRVAKSWSQWFAGGVRPPAAEHPQAYPFAGALLGRVLGDTLLAMRVLPVAALLLLGFTLRKWLMFGAADRQGLNVFLLLMIGASPFLLRHALVAMSDLPGIALVVLTWALWTKAQEQRSLWWMVMCAVVALLAVVVRFAAVPMVLGLLMLTWVGKAEGRSQRMLIGAGLAVVGMLCAWFLIPTAEWVGIYLRSPLADWSPMNLFRRELHSDDGVLKYLLPNGLYVLGVLLHPGFVPIGAVLLPFVRRSDLAPLAARAAAVMLAFYLLFIAGMPFQNDRVLLMAQPFAVILLYPTFLRAWSWLKQRVPRAGFVVALVAVVQLALFARALYPFMRNASVEKELAEVVNHDGATRLYTHGMGAALSNYCPTVQVTELWYTGIDDFQEGALIVVNPLELEAQWKGLNPSENWERAQAQGVRPLVERSDGWWIYRVQ
ncbi:MAG: hypothetical protein IPO90_04500 [Flavobacteriales bacterium]|nr:hypothetical protein [Flavobacteriales bacterium]